MDSGTISEALHFGSTTLITRSITENMNITNVKFTIIGADTAITITGKGRITNRTVTFNTVKIAGVQGFSLFSNLKENRNQVNTFEKFIKNLYFQFKC
jgi:hypothetical protein